jgi:acetolactate decarboxylase
MKKTSIILFLGALFLIVPSLAVGGPVVTQVSTYDALLNGIYDGYVTVKELLAKGDLGIGTYHALDGELIILDGKIYQVKSDGKVSVPPTSLTTPFAMVAMFKPQVNARVEKGSDYPTFEKIVNATGPNKNLFWAVKMKGQFSQIKLRSVPAQNKPYPPLAEVTKTQPVFNLENVSGTILGIRTPAYFRGLAVPGYHFHFITDDFKAGGHVMAFTLAEGTILEIDTCNQYNLILPEKDKIFSEVDLSIDRSAEIGKTQR